MKLSIKSLIAGSALLLASTSALAFTDTYGPEGSSVSLLAYNGSNSYLIDLGKTYDQMLGDINGLSAGGVLTFALPGLATTFGLPGSQPSGPYGLGIRFGVLAGNSNVFNALVSFTADPAITDDRISAITDGAINAFYGRSNVGCASALVCNSTPADDHWGGEPSNSLDTTYFGENMLDQVPFVFSTQDLDDAIGFYYLTLDDFDPNTDEATLLGAWRVVYDASLNSWAAVFTKAGGVTPPVPLPAAVWLLLSGLAGLGIVGRRKSAVAA